MIQVLKTLNAPTVTRLLAQGRSAETLDQIINHLPYQLTPREIRIPDGAFNSSSRIYTSFHLLRERRIPTRLRPRRAGAKIPNLEAPARAPGTAGPFSRQN